MSVKLSAYVWDGLAQPSLEHGITTIVPGNCSLSLAPLKAEHRDLQSREVTNQGLEIDEYSREKMNFTLKELTDEAEAVKAML